MKTNPLTTLLLLGVALGAAAANPPVAPPGSGVDRAVFGQLRRLRITPAGLCTDEVFLRRVYLDTIGTLPDVKEVQAFLKNGDRGKRRALIDRLLERREFADYWAMKWSDLLRVKSEFPINLWPNAAQAYYGWIWTSLRENKPYDRFVRELLTSQGSNFRVPPVNFFRALQSRTPKGMALATAQTFLGCRADKWSPRRLEGFSAFFTKLGYKRTGEWKEEIVHFKEAFEPGVAPQPLTAMLPDGTTRKIPPGQDPRRVLADWLIKPRNPWFARAIVNRIWYWLQGRAIIHPCGDLQADNKPANEALLRHLERELTSHRWDLKHIYREILNSRVYQLSSLPAVRHPQGEANFAWYPLRRLEAEVLIDAICKVTGTTEEYSSAIPEPFTFIPKDHRSITLPDGSITSPFLEMFGRPSRDTGMIGERNNKTSPAQRLHLLNSSHIQNKLERGPMLRQLMRRGRRNPRQVVGQLYMAILSRPPTPDEIGVLQEISRSRFTGRTALIDLAWALINSPEFLFRH